MSLISSFLFFALSYVTNIVFARILSPADYGDYAIGMTTLALGSLVALAGSGQAMTRFVPAYLASGDAARASGFIRFFVPFAVGSGLIVGLVVWLAREIAIVGFGFHEADVTLHPVMVAGAIIAVFSLAILGTRVLRSFGLVTMSFLPTRVIAPLFTLALVATLAAVDVGLTDWMVMAAVGAGFLVAVVVQVIEFVRHGHHRIVLHKPVYELRTWFATAAPLMFAMLLSELLHHGDLIMLEFIAEGEDVVGQYAAVNNTVLFLSIMIASVQSVVGPMLGAAIGRGSPARIQWLLGSATTMLLVACGTVAVGMIAFRDPLLGLFGPSYLGASDALAIATIAYAFNAIVGLCRPFLQFLGYHRYAVWPMVGAVPANLGLDVLLIPPWGVNGAAIATLATLVSMRALQVAALYWQTGFEALPLRIRLSARAQRLWLG